MYDQKIKDKKPHNVIMNNCEKLSLSGIVDVGKFDENVVFCYTDENELVIKGKNIHIDKIDLQSGDIDISGKIGALIYTGETRRNTIFSKLFK